MLSVSLQTTDTELERKNELFLLHMYDAIYATLKAFFFLIVIHYPQLEVSQLVGVRDGL